MDHQQHDEEESDQPLRYGHRPLRHNFSSDSRLERESKVREQHLRQTSALEETNEGRQNAIHSTTTSLLEEEEEGEDDTTTASLQCTSSYSIEPCSSVDTALLIQSAAKCSVLDSSTTPSCSSRSHSPCHGNGDQQQQQPTTPQHSFPDNDGGSRKSSLQSLQIPMVPALPDEQDRKRFVGCLAAVLASSYEYETTAEAAVGSSSSVDHAMKMVMPSTSSRQDLSLREDKKEEAWRRQNNNTSQEEEVIMAYLEQSAHGSSDEDSDDEHAFDRSRRRTHYNDSNQRLNNDSLHHSSSVLLSSKKRRYRKRRYDVSASILSNTADWLWLEKSQTKAFLPLLAKLLLVDKTAQRQQYQRPTDSSFSSGWRQQVDSIEHLGPFLESMTPGAGIRCLALFLIQYLLHSETGYDARIRHVVKTLGVLLILHDDKAKHTNESNAGGRSLFDEEEGRSGFEGTPPRSSVRNGQNRPVPYAQLVSQATRRFEALEHSIALRLLKLSTSSKAATPRQRDSSSSKRKGKSSRPRNEHQSSSAITQRSSSSLMTREQVVRSLKVGGTALAAGTLFAVTGGLAAPGIAAGLASIAGSTALTAAAATVLTSTAAVTTIFGVGGGGLVAYKMQRRTQGLTEFEFHKETSGDGEQQPANSQIEAELFSTICLSGWLRDKHDFQRPWGAAPSNPPLQDRLELLERFYSIYRPDHVGKSATILERWQGEERELWRLLRQKYSRDPDHLFPLDDGPRFRGGLTLEQEEAVDRLFAELGLDLADDAESKQSLTPLERMKGWKKRFTAQVPSVAHPQSTPAKPFLGDSLHGPHGFGSNSDHGFESSSAVSASSEGHQSRDGSQESVKLPKHLATVWDYHAHYGGELYTIRWESDLLMELCDSVSDLAFDVVSGGTAQVLKHTALSALMSSIAWPYALVNAANMIDGTWTLAVERADEAGKELARSLLFSPAGNRPVTLVGYSFGARTVYSCLKELARYQEKWEDFHEQPDSKSSVRKPGSSSMVENEGSEDFYRFMREPASIVEDAILMGLPNHLSLSSWKVCRQVVAGRLVNCYSQRDLILSLMFQFKKFGFKPVTGTCPVNVNGVENVDVTDLISGHQQYCFLIGEVLKRVRHGEPFQKSLTAADFLSQDDGDSGRWKLTHAETM